MKDLIVIFEKNTMDVKPHLKQLLKEKLIDIDEHIKDLQILRQHVASFLDSPKEAFNQMEEFKQ